MRKVKVSESKSCRLNLRLTNEEMNFIKDVSGCLKLTPSEYIRKCIDKMMYLQEGYNHENK